MPSRGWPKRPRDESVRDVRLADAHSLESGGPKRLKVGPPLPPRLRDYIKAASTRFERNIKRTHAPGSGVSTLNKMIALASMALLCLVVCGSAAVPYSGERVERQADLEPVPILKHSVDGPNPDGSYAFSFETGNGIKAEEQGELKPGGEDGIASVRGSYSYQSDDGTPVSLIYTADENGFQPQGAHLPVAPPIPEAILKALEWIAAHPEEDNLKK